MTEETPSTSLPLDLFLHLDEVLSELSRPGTGLVLDFDGTIAELVKSPDQARIYPAIAGPLERLARKLKLMAVMSGRAASDIHQKVGIEGITYVGNHGAEYISNGRLSVVEEAARSSANIEEVFEHMKPIADGPGVIWENKGFSAAVHYRMAPDGNEARSRLASALEDARGIEDLDVFWGNMVLEIRARVGVNKGYAIKRLAREWQLGNVIFLGDDTTDADALRAINESRAKGEFKGFGVAVIQEGTPATVLEAANYSLRGVPEVARFLALVDEAITDN